MTTTNWTSDATGTGEYASVNGIDLYYETHGSGRPLVLLHGGLTSPDVLDDAVLEPREIRSAQFCTLDEVRERCADFTARRVEAALRMLDGGGSTYTESGRA